MYSIYLYITYIYIYCAFDELTTVVDDEFILQLIVLISLLHSNIYIYTFIIASLTAANVYEIRLKKGKYTKLYIVVCICVYCSELCGRVQFVCDRECVSPCMTAIRAHCSTQRDYLADFGYQTFDY